MKLVEVEPQRQSKPARLLTLEVGGLLQATALEVAEGRIAAIYVTRNPEKLRHLSSALAH